MIWISESESLLFLAYRRQEASLGDRNGFEGPTALVVATASREIDRVVFARTFVIRIVLRRHVGCGREVPVNRTN